MRGKVANAFARDQLRVNAARRQGRNDLFELAVPHQRLTADDRHVKRLVAIDQGLDAVDELLTLEVAHLT